MALAASGALALTVEALERLVASSATLQALFGAADADAAKVRIHWLQSIQEIDEEAADVSPDPQPFIHDRPFAIVDISEDGREMIGIGEWAATGSVIVAVEVAVPSAYQVDRSVDSTATIKSKFADRQTWGLNQAGLIRDEMMANSGLSDASDNAYINLVTIELESGPGDPEDDEPSDYIGFVLSGKWN